MGDQRPQEWPNSPGMDSHALVLCQTAFQALREHEHRRLKLPPTHTENWVFVKRGMDGFRYGCPSPENTLVCRRDEFSLPKISRRGAYADPQSRQKKPLKEAALFSKLSPAQLTRMASVEEVEGQLMAKHPLAMHPDLGEDTPQISYDRILRGSWRAHGLVVRTGRRQPRSPPSLVNTLVGNSAPSLPRLGRPISTQSLPRPAGCPVSARSLPRLNHPISARSLPRLGRVSSLRPRPPKSQRVSSLPPGDSQDSSGVQSLPGASQYWSVSSLPRASQSSNVPSVLGASKDSASYLKEQLREDRPSTTEGVSDSPEPEYTPRKSSEFFKRARDVRIDEERIRRLHDCIQGDRTTYEDQQIKEIKECATDEMDEVELELDEMMKSFIIELDEMDEVELFSQEKDWDKKTETTPNFSQPAKMRHGGPWYPKPKLCEKLTSDETSIGPKPLLKKPDEPDILDNLYGPIAFKDFILSKGYEMPGIIERLFTRKGWTYDSVKTPMQRAIEVYKYKEDDADALEED
ncbi:Protein FAM47A [Plecturocebus cupreus]